MTGSTRSVIVASASFAVMFAFATPLAAQRGRAGSQEGRTQGQAVARRASPAPAPSAKQQVQRPQAPPARAAQVQRQAPPPATRSARPQVQRPPQAPPVNAARPAPQPRYAYGPQNPYPPSRGHQPRVAPYSNFGRSTHEVRRPVFVQPYYAFRPRFSVGFGIRIGYAVPYPFRYYDPFGFYNFGIGVVAGYGPHYGPYAVGGLNLDIAPYDAAVFIDGEYVGIAADFSPTQMPLTLAAGRHRVDLRAPGFMSVAFDITVVPGQVIPYAGTLPYAR